MNKLGVSSSCFYPQPTEVAFDKICVSGIKTAEIFFNSVSEVTPEFVKPLAAKREDNGIDVVSVHTYTGFADSFNLFTDYERRFSDGLEIYKKLSECASILGAKYVVMHGAKSYHTVPDEVIGQRFNVLAQTVAAEGAMLCYENVNQYRSSDPAFLRFMMECAQGKAGAVLDIKQARRAGVPYSEFVNTLGSHIKHIHISDFNENFDCIVPLAGYFDFVKFFEEMTANGYNGAYIIELYKKSYSVEEDILKAHNLLIENYNNLC